MAPYLKNSIESRKVSTHIMTLSRVLHFHIINFLANAILSSFNNCIDNARSNPKTWCISLLLSCLLMGWFPVGCVYLFPTPSFFAWATLFFLFFLLLSIPVPRFRCFVALPLVPAAPSPSFLPLHIIIFFACFLTLLFQTLSCGPLCFLVGAGVFFVSLFFVSEVFKRYCCNISFSSEIEGYVAQL